MVVARHAGVLRNAMGVSFFEYALLAVVDRIRRMAPPHLDCCLVPSVDMRTQFIPPSQSMNSSYMTSRVLLLVVAVLASGCSRMPEAPPEWSRLVPVEGMSEPVPEHWLRDEEARIAYSLKLPSGVPKAVPFDFEEARWRAMLPGKSDVDVQYFDHLCKTEAGEWIFKTVQNVEGLYFARPQAKFSTDPLTAVTQDLLQDPFGPEMPWIQRHFFLRPDNPEDQASGYVSPPFANYKFVDQRRRPVEWQSTLPNSYVRLSGRTNVRLRDSEGRLTDHYKVAEPMRVHGIDFPSARYGLTWRGLNRQADRQLGIAGGEVLIYELRTGEVLAVRRQFLIARPRNGKTYWEVAVRCASPTSIDRTAEVEQFAFDVLQTNPTSFTGKKR